MLGEKIKVLLSAQKGHLMAWVPLALMVGIALYFFLPREPHISIMFLTFAGASGLWIWGRGRAIAVLLGAVLCGFGLAQARTLWVATPLIHSRSPELAITGIVYDLSYNSQNQRVIILAPTEIEGFTAEKTPRYLRLTGLLESDEVAIGNVIATNVRLSPLPSPVSPGAFDYGQQLYFKSIGGMGRIVAPTAVIGQATSSDLWLLESLGETRAWISERLFAVIDPTTAAVADAMITGERGAIPSQVNKSFQISGLAHILSISGLHMSLAAGGVFWVVRALLALFPKLVQRYPIKKWAALAALAFGLFYMLLADGGAATIRSYIMLAIMFFAILVDRPAISMRNLALAAIIILVLMPEQAIQASFQMSFLAVMGLVAFYEAWKKRKRAQIQRSGPWIRRFYKAGEILFLSMMTTLVAGAFSAIPAVYHFGRIAPYSMLANGIAIPVISLIVMPMAMLSVLLMPFGLEKLPVMMLGAGIDLVIKISDWVAALPGAPELIPQPPLLSILLLGLAAMIFCIARQGLKLLTLPVLLLAGLALITQHSPDILIEETGANVAFRDDGGQLIFARPSRGKFSAERWLVRNGEDTTLQMAATRPGWQCDDKICQATIKGTLINYYFSESFGEMTCPTADIVIASFPLRHRCRGQKLTLDRFDVWREGAHAVFVKNGDVSVATVAHVSGQRPWVTTPEPRKKTSVAAAGETQ